MLGQDTSFFAMLKHGGFTMVPLVICSLVGWAVIFERIWKYRKLNEELRAFHLEAMNALLRSELDRLKTLCRHHATLPTSILLQTALDRIYAKDKRLQKNWVEALDRKRLVLNQELRKNLWVLGTIGSSAPFIGLAGTVIGILSSFNEMAKRGAGGFTVVAAGISEALIATAAGIVVAVIAVMAFNAFQSKWSALVLLIRVQTEEMAEALSIVAEEDSPGAK